MSWDEALSEMTTSQSGSSCIRTDSTAWRRSSSRFLVGRRTENITAAYGFCKTMV
jgi:hypothetical protein